MEVAEHRGRRHRDDTHQTGLSVPSLFRQMLNDSGKQRKPTSREIAGQTAYVQVGKPLTEVRAEL